MATIDKIDISGAVVGTCEVPTWLSACEVSPGLVHECIVAERARQRQGTAHTKTKGEIRCTTKKPWRQKGTGRARAGHRGSVVWRGGGVVFGPRYRRYDKRVSKNTRRQVIRGVFADKVREGGLCVIDTWDMSAPKTATFAGLQAQRESRRLLCVGVGDTRTAQMSARNIATVDFVDVSEVTTYALITHDTVIMSATAWEAFLSRIAAPAAAEEVK